jgi:hypothetical protein
MIPIMGRILACHGRLRNLIVTLHQGMRLSGRWPR